ncbi:MAG: hypothetical protein RJB56_453, partial [Actinomycetota bacterium]
MTNSWLSRITVAFAAVASLLMFTWPLLIQAQT